MRPIIADHIDKTHVPCIAKGNPLATDPMTSEVNFTHPRQEKLDSSKKSLPEAEVAKGPQEGLKWREASSKRVLVKALKRPKALKMWVGETT